MPDEFKIRRVKKMLSGNNKYNITFIKLLLKTFNICDIIDKDANFGI